MIIQPHRIHVGENTKEELVLNLPTGANVLHVHHFGLPHGYVEIIESHDDEHLGDTTPRRFIVIDSYCSGPIKLPQSNLRFINALPFDNHIWTFFEVLE